MTGSTRAMSRRTFLRDLGYGAFALTIVGLASCARGRDPSPRADGPAGDPLLNYTDNLDEIESFWCQKDLPAQAPIDGQGDPDKPENQRWGRIGDVRASGYVLVRGGEATIVDTGPWCTPEVIEAALSSVGLGWGAVGSVIVTHKHPDHWVGLSTALERAKDAAVFAGAPDIPHIGSPRPVKPIGIGDRVMDLAIIPTPGHTPGHIAVHDEAAGVLVVGDAAGYVSGSGFELLRGTSEDLPKARASLNILAGLSFDTLLPGHGDPIVAGAWEELTEYLALK